MGATYGVLRLPARDIRVPSSVSPQAQAVIAARPSRPGEYPPIDDKPAWRAYVKATTEALMPYLQGRSQAVNVECSTCDFGAFSVHEAAPTNLPSDDRSVILEFHGGTFILMGGEPCKLLAARSASRTQRRIWSVDYRMPPDHPYPAAVEDGVTAYRALLKERSPGQIVFSGGSAGGNIATAVILRARDEGLPLPAGALLVTPQLDLSESGDSFQTAYGLEPGVGDVMPTSLLYAGGHDLRDPGVSPLFGDYVPGFPPTMLVSGTRDIFMSNVTRLHRRLRDLGIRAELHVEEGGGHGGFPDSTPEGASIAREIRLFFASVQKAG